MAVTLPATLIFIDIFLIKNPYNFTFSRPYFISLVNNKIILFAASFAFSLIAIFTQRATIEENSVYDFSSRLVNAATALLHHVSTTVFPYNLSPYYPINKYVVNLDIIGISILFSILIAVVLLVLVYKKWTPFPLAIAIYLLITIFPVIGLIKVGHAAYADRYMYIPSLGLYLALAYLLSLLITTSKIRILKILGVFVIISYAAYLSFTTYNYTSFWKKDDVLWQRVVTLYPNRSSIPYNNLGSFYALTNDSLKAIKYYNRALTINPTSFETIHNLAKLYSLIGDQNNAKRYYDLLIKTHPSSAKAFIVSGDYFFSKKEFKLAGKYYNIAFKLSPGNLIAIYKTAFMDTLNKKYALATKKLNAILSADGHNKEALQLLASIKLEIGQLSAATSIANTILKLDPNDQTASAILKSVTNLSETERSH
jgi:tetratricopeptide (TPR) repeat protein